MENNNINEPYIETFTGKKFSFENPVFDIDDISHALANSCRYVGHCKQFYSTAEHSVMVAKIMDDLNLGDPFEGLMHDAQEAYLSDISGPWKILLPDYRKIEGDLESKLRQHFEIGGDVCSPGCKEADWIALFCEARDLITSGGKDWGWPENIKNIDWDYYPQCWNPRKAEQRFKRAFERYRYYV